MRLTDRAGFKATKRRMLARKKSSMKSAKKALRRSSQWRASPYTTHYLTERIRYLQSALAYSTDVEEQNRIQGEIDSLKNDLAASSVY